MLENSRLKAFLQTTIAVWLFFSIILEKEAAENISNIELRSNDRILILAPHPDDEILGCSGIIQEALAKNLPIQIVFLTYGDNNEWSFFVYRKRLVLAPKAVRQMGLLRRSEAIEAAKLLGLTEDHLIFLGYPDFGTFNMWCKHWNQSPPFKGLLTRVTYVPYSNAFRPNTPYKSEEILKDLETIIQDFKPSKVFVSHPADHNPDHRALYLFTRVALWELKPEAAPEIYPYLVHFKHWPRPKGYHPERFLAPPQELEDEISWLKYSLDEKAVRLKEAALQTHKTQYAYSGNYLDSFACRNELFGDFPEIEAEMISTGSENREVLSTAFLTTEPPDELTDKEKASFIGIELRWIKLQENSVKIKIEFSRPLSKLINASVYLFGYREDTPFSKMPKIRIHITSLGYFVCDQKKKISSKSVTIKKTLKTMILTVPLDMLGEPDKILSSARTSLDIIPLDWVSWRIIKIKKSPAKSRP